MEVAMTLSRRFHNLLSGMQKTFWQKLRKCVTLSQNPGRKRRVFWESAAMLFTQTFGHMTHISLRSGTDLCLFHGRCPLQRSSTVVTLCGDSFLMTRVSYILSLNSKYLTCSLSDVTCSCRVGEVSGVSIMCCCIYEICMWPLKSAVDIRKLSSVSLLPKMWLLISICFNLNEERKVHYWYIHKY